MDCSNLRVHRASIFLLLVMTLSLIAGSAFAQGNLGRIVGTVLDQSGGAIAGSTVTVTDVQRGTTRTLTTDQSGEYAAPNLQPGTYTVRTEASGFKTTERTGLLLQVGQDMRIDLTLQPGEQTQTVTVTEQAPLVQTTNATLSATLSNETLNELPLNGRNYQNLLVLRPGSLFYAGGGGWTQSTNGSRPEDNGYIVDGLTNDHPLTGLTIINGAGVAGDAATILPIDAIQELNVMENPPAEYGWKPGAIVNVGLKSGTNTLHGTAYAFGRSDALDARNYFNVAPTPKQPVGLEQFGATGGGAIKKDKLFYFLGFEDERYTLGNLFNVRVPQARAGTTFDPAHSLPDAITDLRAHGVQPSALSLKLTGCTVGPPVSCTGGLYPTNNGSSPNFQVGFPSDFKSDNGLAKIDFHLNDHHAINGMYFISRGSITAQDLPYLQPYWLSQQINEPQVFGVNWTWTPNSRWVNEARFGYTYMNRATHSVDSNVPASSYGINTGVTSPLFGGFPMIIVGGYANLGGFAAWPINFGPSKIVQIVDAISYLKGSHNIKFGGEIHRNSVSEGRFSRGKGVLLFFGGRAFGGSSSIQDFLAGDPAGASLLIGTKTLQLSTQQYAGWIQDDWRVTRKLTLNLGLRYEFLTPLKEANNLLGNFDPSLGLVQVGKQINSVYNPDYKDFGPRVGLAWDVTGNAKTVVHAGYSIVHNGGIPMFVFIGQGGTNNANALGLGSIPTSANIVVNGTSTPGTGTIQYANISFRGGASSTLASNWRNNSSTVPLFPATTLQCGDGAGPDPGPCDVLGVDRNFKTPYTSNWTLGVEHAFTNNLSLNVAYVGNHGARLPGIRDINQAVPVKGSPDANPGPLSAKFPYLGFINQLSNLYRSNYNGLQTTFTQRTTHGLSFVAAYTYSHALDQSSFNIGVPLPQDSTHPEREYGNSVFDIKHRFTFSLTYAVPAVKSFAQLLEGWSVNSVVTLQSGAPWGALDSSNNISGTNELSDRWDFFGNPHDFKSGNSSIPYCTGPGAGGCTRNTPAGSVDFSAAASAAFWTACLNAAKTVDGGSATGPTTANLNSLGCFAQGGSVMIPPAVGTFGTMGRNIFRDSGFRNVDFSVTKSWHLGERVSAQFRSEFFNIFNHPNFANPYGGSNGFAHNDPSSPADFGCGCATPDQAGGNPVLGTGGNRAIQLGLKFIF